MSVLFKLNLAPRSAVLDHDERRHWLLCASLRHRDDRKESSPWGLRPVWWQLSPKCLSLKALLCPRMCKGGDDSGTWSISAVLWSHSTSLYHWIHLIIFERYCLSAVVWWISLRVCTSVCVCVALSFSLFCRGLKCLYPSRLASVPLGFEALWDRQLLSSVFLKKWDMNL